MQHVEDEKKLGELVERADGFAEVFPEHKYEIVNILQKRNHMVRPQLPNHMVRPHLPNVVDTGTFCVSSFFWQLCMYKSALQHSYLVPCNVGQAVSS